MKTIAIALAVIVGAAAVSAAQAPVAPAPPDKPARPAIEGQPSNVRIEVSISDQAGTGAPSKRTVTLIVADRHTGSVRSQGQPSANTRTATLNVDATPTILKEGQLRLALGLEYLPRPADNPIANEGPGSLNQRITLIAESGKPMVIVQAADPTSDRRMSIELTATILK